jgi:hypothetical protein
MNTGAEESTVLGGGVHYHVKTQQTEALVHAVVNCSVSELAIVLSLIVDMGCKSLINPITNPNLVSSHLTRHIA